MWCNGDFFFCLVSFRDKFLTLSTLYELLDMLYVSR